MEDDSEMKDEELQRRKRGEGRGNSDEGRQSGSEGEDSNGRRGGRGRKKDLKGGIKERKWEEKKLATKGKRDRLQWREKWLNDEG